MDDAFWPVVLVVIFLIVALLAGAYVAGHDLEELLELESELSRDEDSQV
jgi:hypothetical protein